jgi:hypothetical protein
MLLALDEIVAEQNECADDVDSSGVYSSRFESPERYSSEVCIEVYFCV